MCVCACVQRIVHSATMALADTINISMKYAHIKNERVTKLYHCQFSTLCMCSWCRSWVASFPGHPGNEAMSWAHALLVCSWYTYQFRLFHCLSHLLEKGGQGQLRAKTLHICSEYSRENKQLIMQLGRHYDLPTHSCTPVRLLMCLLMQQQQMVPALTVKWPLVPPLSPPLQRYHTNMHYRMCISIKDSL